MRSLTRIVDGVLKRLIFHQMSLSFFLFFHIYTTYLHTHTPCTHDLDDLLKLKSTISKVYRETSEKERISSEQRFSRSKHHVDV